MRRRNVVVAQVNRDRSAVDVAAKVWMLLERFKFRAEKQRLARPSVIQGLFAGAISRQVQHLFFAVPQTKREHAIEFLERSLDAPAGNRREHDLGVGVATKCFAELLQLLPQSFEIVNFAVERHDVAAARGVHRLGAHRREIDDREAAVAECDAGVLVNPDTVGVRSAMAQTRCHASRDQREQIGRAHV